MTRYLSIFLTNDTLPVITCIFQVFISYNYCHKHFIFVVNNINTYISDIHFLGCTEQVYSKENKNIVIQ